MCVLPASASAECTSMSGLRPGETLRNTLRITVSPKTTEVLLCSAPTTIDGPPGGSSSTLGSRWKASPGRRARAAMPSDPVHRGVLVVQRVVEVPALAVVVDLLADERVREVLLRLGRRRPAAAGSVSVSPSS